MKYRLNCSAALGTINHMLFLLDLIRKGGYLSCHLFSFPIPSVVGSPSTSLPSGLHLPSILSLRTKCRIEDRTSPPSVAFPFILFIICFRLTFCFEVSFFL
jgi:hypothetical protein